jgi:hypothetical protein
MDRALEAAIAELRAVHETAMKLATAMREFGREAEEVAALIRELEAA